MSKMDLIARLEASPKPDRKLDAEIAASIHSEPAVATENGDVLTGNGVQSSLFYTASADTAVLLCGEAEWIVERAEDGYHANVWNGQGWSYGWSGYTPALALCAAALRARQK